MIQVKVAGLNELAEALRALPREIASKNGGPLARALSKQARKIRNAARVRAPVDTGRLRNAIVMLRDRKPEERGHTEAYFVYVKPGKSRKDLKGAFYANIVERGSEKQSAKPFMRPAYASHQKEVTEGFATDLREGIERSAKKVARRGR